MFKDIISTTTGMLSIVLIGVLFGVGFGQGFCYVVKDKIVAVVPVSEIKK